MRTIALILLLWTGVSLALGALWGSLRWTPSRRPEPAPVGAGDVPAPRATTDRPLHRV